MDVVNYFGAAMESYRKADFITAERNFKKCLELNPEDGLSATYVSRCQYLATHAPEGDWTGVWVMKEK